MARNWSLAVKTNFHRKSSSSVKIYGALAIVFYGECGAKIMFHVEFGCEDPIAIREARSEPIDDSSDESVKINGA